MPSLTIKPPRRPSQTSATSPPRPRQEFTYSAPPSNSDTPYNRSASPVAPAFSPITPKVQPALPYPSYGAGGPVPPDGDTHVQQGDPAIESAVQYIPQPPPRPFSDTESTDAIALRAAISALQFQRQKARDDLKTLEALKKQAIDEPEHFRTELAAGRLQERRPIFGGLEAVLANADSDDDDDNDDVHDNGEPTDERTKMEGVERKGHDLAEVPDSQSSLPQTSFSPMQAAATDTNKPANFSHIPGMQDVVRMPHINWEKYHINRDALDALHEQQRRWPGSFAYGTDRGRESAVVAPFSPFLDQLGGQPGGEVGGSRKDSAAISSALATPTGAVNEHPMETRRSSSKYHP